MDTARQESATLPAATAGFDIDALCAVLTQARLDAGLSLDALAARTGVHKSVLSRIETGVIVSPRFEVIARMAFVLGLSLDGLAAQAGLPRVRVMQAEGVELTVADDRLKLALLALTREPDTEWSRHIVATLWLLVQRKNT